MAKARQDGKHDGKHDEKHNLKPTKKVVSTSRMFKKQASPKTKHGKGKTASRQPLQEKKARSKHKREPTPEHILVAKFNEATDNSRDHIQKECGKFLKITANDFSERLRKSNEDFSKQLEADGEVNETFFKPLGDEELQFARKDGSQVGSAALRDRVKKFKKIIVAEEKELGSLWQQLAQVNEELAAEAEGVLGPDWARIIGCTTPGEPGEASNDGQPEIAEDLERTKSYFEDLIDKASERHLEEMKGSEKDFKIKMQKRKKKMLEIMKGDD